MQKHLQWFSVSGERSLQPGGHVEWFLDVS
jgi:hypothetical protein